MFVFIFFKIKYNKTIIGFGFCNMLNNQDHGKYYQLGEFGLVWEVLCSDIDSEVFFSKFFPRRGI